MSEETPPPSYDAATSNRSSLNPSTASLTSRLSVSPQPSHLLDTPVPESISGSTVGALTPSHPNSSHPSPSHLTPSLLTPSHLNLPDITPPHHGVEQPLRSNPTSPTHSSDPRYTPAPSLSILDGPTANNSPVLSTIDVASRRSSVENASIDEIVENALKAKRQGHQSGDTASSTSLNEKEDTISLEASHTKVSWQEEVESNGLVRFENLPNWRQDNAFILAHHRPTSYSYKKSLRSIFGLNNETINIHSHLLGFFLFALSPIYIYNSVTPRWHNTTAGDFIVFAFYFFGVAICFLSSFWFHTVANHSRQIAEFWVQFDFLGIVILMWGATIASVYYGFYCDHTLRWIYWSVVSVLSILCVISTLYKGFQTPVFRPYRAMLFAFLGISSLAFIVHGIKIHGWQLQFHRMSLGWMGLMALLNFIGAGAYAARVPERWTKGKTDVWGHSHQWLHIFVVLAGVAHAFGLVAAFDYVHGPGIGGDCLVTHLPTTVATGGAGGMGSFINGTVGNDTLGNTTALANATVGIAKVLNATTGLLSPGNLTRMFRV